MFFPVSRSGQMNRAIFSQRSLVEDIFKMSKVENGLLRYSCYLNIINPKLPFDTWECIS